MKTGRCGKATEVEILADEIWSLVEKDQGYGFLSDGMDTLESKEKLFAVVRGALKHTEIAAKKMRKWLKKYGEF